ncbi:MAG: FAD-dependent oxidoreductase [Candidatus Omnitrophica bacterium]|nr:FAD-dependent oxidoreductase [Candidatus Omnitrophota bacterium]MCF7894199.1 FAD-dependent oxidoreductase [Candidatus Omnitrophota bacterium]
MGKSDILIVGAGPAGMVAATTAKTYYPDKSITIIKSIKSGCIPCGIPYMFSSLKDPSDNKLKTDALEKKGVKVFIDQVISIDSEEKKVKTKNNKEYSYQKLILAIGSKPIVPPIDGIDKEGVFPIHKDMDYLKKAIAQIKKKKNVLVVGGGFIGVEFADEISNIEGIKVTLIEMRPHLLLNSFDREFSHLVEDKLKKKGVKVITGARAEKIVGSGKVEQVDLSDGRKIDAEGVILGIGACPNTDLAKDAGLDLSSKGGILVDEYMRSSDPNIFAVGDCSCKRDFFTRKAVPVMLASTATAEARVAGANLYKIKVVRENKGTIAVYSTYVDGLVLSSAGLTEENAQKESFEIITGQIEGMDKHPGTLPGAQKSIMKLVFSKQSGIILGGQVSCGMACAQLINLVGVAIQKRMSATELETLQMATHPYLTSSPTKYPVVLAAQEALKKE